jgi:phosphatidylglycerophosphatase A
MRPPVATKTKALRPLNRVGYAIATGFGAGHAPVAPGTFGAAEGVMLFIINFALNQRLMLGPVWSLAAFFVINIALYGLGVWAADQAIAATGLKDPSVVVIDEVSGQLIAMTPLVVWPSLAGVVVSFLLFRAFDIFKPYPIRHLERARAGFGVMNDDVLAGVYAAVLTWLVHQLGWV